MNYSMILKVAGACAVAGGAWFAPMPASAVIYGGLVAYALGQYWDKLFGAKTA